MHYTQFPSLPVLTCPRLAVSTSKNCNHTVNQSVVNKIIWIEGEHWNKIDDKMWVMLKRVCVCVCLCTCEEGLPDSTMISTNRDILTRKAALVSNSWQFTRNLSLKDTPGFFKELKGWQSQEFTNIDRQFLTWFKPSCESLLSFISLYYSLEIQNECIFHIPEEPYY